ncbi:hypothetical protein T440DRAFT_250197 [Plenodomus tracheiphilus IPT5]|uniref:Uncharacterized protein n=1 Tax=Plenodomus tracheiphilus IPT5 TaxID=1408161 RepID=A0A6A7AUG3_9PLEO|nr:hypothetical protein T440DRAFT_250197 [Plenodomus tracheiphilus IPT5]
MVADSQQMRACAYACCVGRIRAPVPASVNIIRTIHRPAVHIADMMSHPQTTPTYTYAEKQKSGFKAVLRRWKATFKGKDPSSQFPKSAPSPGQDTCTTTVTDPSVPSRPSSQPSRLPQATPRTSTQMPRRPASSLTKHSQYYTKSSQTSRSRLPLPPPPDSTLTFTKPTTQTIIHSPMDKRNRTSSSSPMLSIRRSYLGPYRDTPHLESVSIGGTAKSRVKKGTKPQSHSQPTRSDAGSVAASHTSRESRTRFSLKVGSVKMMREERQFEKGGGWK